jgi:ribosomal protein S18 acetylase RimI-like enzyme
LNDIGFVTRPCRAGDARALSAVAQATILETYAGITNGEDLITYVNAELTVADFERMLASDHIRAWIAETSAGSFSSFELKRLYIFYRFHGSGLGRRLMEDVLSFGRQKNSETIWLQVHEANNHAIEFYKRFGFEQRGADVFRAGENSYRVLTFGLTLPR